MSIPSATCPAVRVPARDFPQFMNLPKEIRDLIWKFAIETRKVMPIRVESLAVLDWSTCSREMEKHSIRISTDCGETQLFWGYHNSFFELISSNR
jgi:hypothetical protein